MASERILGIVTSVRKAQQHKDNIYVAITQNASYSFKCGAVLGLLDKIEAERSALESGFVPLESAGAHGKAKKSEYRALLKKLMACIKTQEKQSLEVPVSELKKPTRSMHAKLKRAAAKFAAALATGAPIVVRFHNDCDGASGAIGIQLAVSHVQKVLRMEEAAITFRMNRSVAYFEDSYYSDYAFTSAYESMEKPVLLITDFGTMTDSEPAMKAASGKCTIIWLDHHPVYKEFPAELVDFYVNTWNFRSDSDYTAGFLACVFARHLAPVDTTVLMEASLISDFSVHGKRDNQEYERMAAFLDYMTSRHSTSENLTPKYLLSIISDKERYSETCERASTLMNEALDFGVKSVKHHKTKSGFSIFVLDYDTVVRSEDFPLPGRYSSRLHDRLEKVNMARGVTLVHYGNYISVRSDRGIAKALDLHALMGDLKKETDYVHSFGGHGPALSVRVDRDHVEDVLSMLVTLLSSKQVTLK